MTEQITLRDGSTTTDPRLDRLVEFDPRSRNYAVSDVLPEGFKSKTWKLTQRLDQGQDGACVGFGTTHRIAALPISFGGANYNYAMGLYHEAQKLDPWPGEDYEGTSVLAGAQAAQARGHFSAYHWCFTIEDYMRALAHEGPVIVGSNWFNDMFDPDERGLLHPTGDVAGGHCWLLRGLTLNPGGVRKGVGPVFRMTNSWGKSWGENGEAYITVEDFERYIMPNGEGCVPTEQRVRRATTEEQKVSETAEAPRGKGRQPWRPSGTSLFNRVQGYGYTPGANRLTGHGKPAGLFKKGPFSLGR